MGAIALAPVVRDTVAEIDRAEWDALMRAAGAPVFYDYSFLYAYEQAPLEVTHAFFYVTFGRPMVAALPAYLQDAEDSAGDIPALGLGELQPGDRILRTHVSHCYDTGLPARVRLPELVGPACEVLADLARQAGAKWFAFLDVAGDGELASELAALGLTKIPMTTRFRRNLSLFCTVDDFVASIPSRKARLALRYARSQGRRVGMRVACLAPSEAGPDAVELCRATTARHGTPGYYPEQLHEFVALADDVTRIIEVRLGDRLAATSVCLFDDTRFHCWAGGFDYTLTDQVRSLFPLIMWPCLDEAITLRRPIFEMGRANSEIKQRFRLESVPLFAFIGRP
jgi:predicted N-acyltransferase